MSLQSVQELRIEVSARAGAMTLLRDSLKSRLTECKRLKSAAGKGMMGNPSSGPGFFHSISLQWASGAPPTWWSGL